MRLQEFLKASCLGLLLSWLAHGESLHANTASPYPVDVKQPDGSVITLYVRGTEKINWYEYVPEIRGVNRAVLNTTQGLSIGRTPGYTVVKDANGQYVFATKDANGNLAPTANVVGKQNPNGETPRRVLPDLARVREVVQARMPEVESPRKVLPAGDVHNLVILMRFKNHRQRTLPTPDQFDVIFNRVGGDPGIAPTGSVFDVYNENSYGQMRLRSKIVGWVDLPKTEQEYAAGNSGLGVVIHSAIKDALDAVVATGTVNFADFDNENGGAGDGEIDAITFVHSGYGAEWGGADASGTDFKDRIWSHRWAIPVWSANPSGVKVSDYNINPGLWSTSGNEPGHIGVICHELGHFFGLPDLYDYSGKGEGVGSWCLMANSWGFDGSQLHPPHFSAWSKIFLGWNKPTVLTTPGTYSAKATALPGAEIYRIDFPGGSASEYLLVENRQPIGNFEGGIVAGSDGVRGGLAVWHIDDSKSVNDDPGHPGMPGWPGNGHHYWVSLLQADGKYELEQGGNRGDGNDVFRSGFVDAINSSTIPSSSSYAGIAVPPITAISSSANVMTFTYGTGGGGGGGNGDGGDGKRPCCPVVASANFDYGTVASAYAVLTSTTLTLNEDSLVQFVANASATTEAATGTDISIGFHNTDIPATPAEDIMWIESLRYVSINPGQWTNFGSTTMMPLSKGTHTIYWKMWGSETKIKFDSSSLLVTAFPQPMPSPTSGPKAIQGRAVGFKSIGVKASSRISNGRPTAITGSDKPYQPALDALLEIIGSNKADVSVRMEALAVASSLDSDPGNCEKLAVVLAKIIRDNEEMPGLRHEAISAVKKLTVTLMRE